MAEVIAPENWVDGIDDNLMLPSRYTPGIFTGNGVKIANNIGEDGINAACRVYDMIVSDYITTYDDRRVFEWKNVGDESNPNWVRTSDSARHASAYGIFQDVKFDSKVYTMGRHRSAAWRIFHETQYSGAIGEWGTATDSNASNAGQNLMKVAQQISKATDRWKQQVLGPDIDKYNLFAIFSGHISGRWVDAHDGKTFDGEGSWVAQPGPVVGQSIPPRFAPIHCMEWDDNNIPLLLQNLKVTWNNLFIPQDNRVIIIDPYYEYRLLMALTGKGVPATDSAYNDLQNGSFTRLMGWDFNFEIPSNYWPSLYVDDNLNVVHSANGDSPFDKYINSINGGTGDTKFQKELAANIRMNMRNFVRTVWDSDAGCYKKIVTNYPLGYPGSDGPDGADAADKYFGAAVEVAYDNFGKKTDYPWTAPGAGYGLATPTGPQMTAHGGKPQKVQVIGAAIYKPAAQLSQEYSNMVTDEGKTMGKYTECVTDVKFDAWVIEQYSHGIIPIIDVESSTGSFAIPVMNVNEG